MPDTESLEARMMMFLHDVFDLTDVNDLATFMTGIVFGMGILTNAPDYANRLAEHMKNHTDPDMRPVPPEVILALEALVPISTEPCNGRKG